VYLIVGHLGDHQGSPVLRYLLIPLGMLLIISLSSVIFRWQSRKLMMKGYLQFYRDSSLGWKKSYAICSTAFVFGTTFFIIAQETTSPHIHITGSCALEVMFYFWCFIFLCLLWQYICLLVDYQRHNRQRLVPDQLNPKGYYAKSEDAFSGNGKSALANFDLKQTLNSPFNRENATLQRQALTIQDMEEQLKVLVNRLHAQEWTRPASRSLDYHFRNVPSYCPIWEYQRICDDKQLLENECKSITLQLQSKQQDLLNLENELCSVQGIRHRLERDLKVVRDALTRKEAKINDMHLLLAVERQSTEKQRLFMEELCSLNSIPNAKTNRRGRMSF